MNARHNQDRSESDVAHPDHRIWYLDSFRALAMIMVVGIHALGFTGLDTATEKILESIVYPIGVPTFFLVDGFLFVSRNQNKVEFDYAGYIVKSGKRLLVPWLVFSVIYGICRFFFEYSDYLPDKLLIGRSWSSIAASAYLSEIAPQMYFLLSLFLIRLLSRAMRVFMAFPPMVSVSVFLCYAVVFRAFDVKVLFFPGLDPVLHALWGLQFYLLGAVLCRCDGHFQRRSLVIALLAFALLGVSKLSPFSLPAIDQYAYLVGLYALCLGAAERFALLQWIGKYTMGIYLLHAPVVLKGVAITLSGVVSKDLLAYYLLVTGFTFVASLLLARIMSAFRIGRYLFGESR